MIGSAVAPDSCFASSAGYCRPPRLCHQWRVLHLRIQNVEIDYQLWRLTAIYFALLVALLITHINSCQFAVLSSVKRIALVSESFDTGLTASIIVYRLLFHRLRKLPGPLEARVSKLYATALSGKSLQYYLELEQMHQKSGTSFEQVEQLSVFGHRSSSEWSLRPRKLSIYRVSAVQAIKGAQTECQKSTWYSQVSDDVTKISLNSSRDLYDHKRRKRVWDRGLSSIRSIDQHILLALLPALLLFVYLSKRDKRS